jgi:hypothetical protein
MDSRNGFGVGCYPNQRPSFDITKGDALMPQQKAGGSGSANATVKVEVKPTTNPGETFSP